MIPKTKISSTILEFAEPLFEQFPETPPIDALRNALKIVITVWNAHTLSLPIWGEPHHLDNLRKLVDGPSSPPGTAEVIEALTIRRHEWFRDDPRAVGEWTVEPSGAGFVFRCDARLPDSGFAGADPTRSHGRSRRSIRDASLIGSPDQAAAGALGAGLSTGDTTGANAPELQQRRIGRLCRKGDPRRTWRWDKGDPDYVAEFGLRRPDVLALIDIARQWTDERPEDEVLFAPIHAWRALGQLQAAEAVEPLLTMQDSLDAWGDQWYLEEFHDVFGLIGPPAVPALAEYLADRCHGEFPRISAANGLCEVAKRHPESRQRVVSALAVELAKRQPDVCSLNAFLVGYLADLGAAESALIIERAYAVGVVDSGICGHWTRIRRELGVRGHGFVPDQPEQRPGFVPPVVFRPPFLTTSPTNRRRGKVRERKAKRSQQKQSRRRNRAHR